MIRHLVPQIESRIEHLPTQVAVQLPAGPLIGPPGAPVRMSFSHWTSLTRLRSGHIGALAEEYVEGKLRLEGCMRDVMAVAASLLPANPAQGDAGWWAGLQRR